MPRITASILMLPLLVIMGDAVGIGGGYLVAVKLLGVNPVRYLENSFQFLHVKDDVVSGVIKAAVFGLIFAGLMVGYATSEPCLCASFAGTGEVTGNCSTVAC